MNEGDLLISTPFSRKHAFSGNTHLNQEFFKTLTRTFENFLSDGKLIFITRYISVEYSKHPRHMCCTKLGNITRYPIADDRHTKVKCMKDKNYFLKETQSQYLKNNSLSAFKRSYGLMPLCNSKCHL